MDTMINVPGSDRWREVRDEESGPDDEHDEPVDIDVWRQRAIDRELWHMREFWHDPDDEDMP